MRDAQSVHRGDQLPPEAWYAVAAILHALQFACWPLLCSFIPLQPIGCIADLANITLSDSEGAVSRLSQLIKYRTVSESQGNTHTRQPENFRLAREYLQRSYPFVWKQLNVETVRGACTCLLHKESPPTRLPWHRWQNTAC